MQYTETELAKLIETVEKEFTTHLNKAEVANAAALVKSEGSASSTLAKAEDSAPPKEKKESKPEDKEAKAPESKEAAPKESEGQEAPAAEGAPAQEQAQEAAPAAEGQPAAAPQEAAAAPAGHGYDEEDMAHMLKMYQSMSKEELLAHHDCVRQCLDAASAQEAPPAAAPGAEQPSAEPMKLAMSEGMDKSEIEDENPVLNSKPTDKGSPTNTEYNKNSGGKQEANAPGKIPGAKSPASKAEGNQMEKSEGSAEVELVKSELAAEQAKSAELKKNFDKATEVLAALVKKVIPQGKAITSLDVIAKSEGQEEVKELSKSEVTEILMKKDQTKFSKNDRDAINSYYLGGSNFNTISHLLKN